MRSIRVSTFSHFSLTQTFTSDVFARLMIDWASSLLGAWVRSWHFNKLTEKLKYEIVVYFFILYSISCRFLQGCEGYQSSEKSDGVRAHSSCHVCHNVRHNTGSESRNINGEEHISIAIKAMRRYPTISCLVFKVHQCYKMLGMAIMESWRHRASERRVTARFGAPLRYIVFAQQRITTHILKRCLDVDPELGYLQSDVLYTTSSPTNTDRLQITPTKPLIWK